MNSKRKKISLIMSLFIIVLALVFSYQKFKVYLKKDNNVPVSNELPEKEQEEPKEEEFKEPVVTTISINAVGDCTLGYDARYGYAGSFIDVYEKMGEDYFFGGVKDIFSEDDLTIINLEGTFTSSTDRADKTFTFRAPESYANMLPKASIEVANLANNHSYDFKEQGYKDTVQALENVGVNYYDNEYYYVYEKNNVKIGMAGIYCTEDPNCTTQVDKVIGDLKEKGVDTIILTFHWGIETHYEQSKLQTELGHYAIDHGVDLVLGHHPHRIQGIENYNGKYIVYSLSNFSFGGNKNPSDKDSFIFHIDYTYEDKNLVDSKILVYPVSMSSYKNKNDYRPTLLEGSERTRVLEKILKYSINVSLS